MTGGSALSKSNVQPTHGYIEKPEAGRIIFFVALLIAVIVNIMPWLVRILGGADYAAKVYALGAPPGPLDYASVGMANTIIVWGYVAVALWHSIVSKGKSRAFLAFACTIFIAWFNEFLGVNYGLVFGPYNYAEYIPWHILGVPLVVAPSWESYLYPAFFLTAYLLPADFMGKSKGLLTKIVSIVLIASVSACIVTAFDLLDDPLWVGLGPGPGSGAWTWFVNGTYAPWLRGGEPVSNFIGWLFTTFEISIIFQLIVNSTPSALRTRSRYLDVYIPLTMYTAYFVLNLSNELIYQKASDVILVGGVANGIVILACWAKFFHEKCGASPNLMGISIAEKALARTT